MKEKLKELLLDWTEDKAREFHNNAKGIRNNSYIWTTDSNGTFLYRDSAAHYFSNDGKIYKLTNEYTEYDFYKHKKLYDVAIKTNKFRLDIPIEQDYLDFNNKNWFYLVVQRPNNRLGVTFFHNLVKRRIDKNYFINFIEQACIILPYLKEIAYEDEGLPHISLPVHKLMFDDKGVFWADFKDWKLDYDSFIQKSISMARDFSKNAGNLLNINLDEIEYIARDKWMKI